nr:hypothetical protein BaRGS_030463 [Batillaria attramentaria]
MTDPKFKSLTEVLRYWSEHDPDQPAFIFHSSHGNRYVMTCSGLYTMAGRWASVLHRDGLGKRQLVANTLPNSPERAVCDAAILLSGAASVNGICQLADGGF